MGSMTLTAFSAGAVGRLVPLPPSRLLAAATSAGVDSGLVDSGLLASALITPALADRIVLKTGDPITGRIGGADGGSPTVRPDFVKTQTLDPSLAGVAAFTARTPRALKLKGGSIVNHPIQPRGGRRGAHRPGAGSSRAKPWRRPGSTRSIQRRLRRAMGPWTPTASRQPAAPRLVRRRPVRRGPRLDGLEAGVHLAGRLAAP